MIDPRFIYLAASIELIGSAAYAWSTLKGNTQPNRVSWLLWGIAPLIGFFAQLSEGVGLVSLLTLSIALGPILVLLASYMNKKAYWKLTKFDYACGAISVLAIIFWLITGKGVIAIGFSILADFMAGLPTILKAYRRPETESSSVFLAGVFSGIITMLTIQNWNFANYGFPIYIFCISGLTYLFIQFPGWRFHSNVVRDA